ncbi:hypothetical protein [Cupriavidus nantongensis]|uniref:Uncharacterized protein n=1 Tax=Cupriavidus nantongensis TaxID=1796606 RepID=A0A142JHS1_9BURK|nr:hypothetical protein [Cupriavidus nantongensis]AMR77633.1 hypothetical protein A2G96_07735 [Cupriavidus nantongensis]
MRTFWLKFNDYPAGCVEAKSESDAKEIAKEVTGHEAASCESLPYPAQPRINKYVDPKYGVCPSFCFKPEQCAGHTACPQPYSCVE